MPAQALAEFRAELNRSRSLLRLEVQTYNDPPNAGDRITVNSLRAGAAILMVASFESFLSDLASECVDGLRKAKKPVAFDKLTENFRVSNVYNTLEFALSGPRYGKLGRKVHRLADIHIAAGLVASKQLNPSAFGHSRGNPNQETLKQVFRDVGVPDILGKSVARFQNKWGSPIPAKFIGEKLDQIVRRRHSIAHGTSALSISRSDLRESFKFLRILAEVLDIEMRQHFRMLEKTAV